MRMHKCPTKSLWSFCGISRLAPLYKVSRNSGGVDVRDPLQDSPRVNGSHAENARPHTEDTDKDVKSFRETVRHLLCW